MAGVLPGAMGQVGGTGDMGHPGCPHAGAGAEEHSLKGSSALLQPHELRGEINVLLERPGAASPGAGT